MTAQSNARVWGRSIAGMASLNHAEVMDIRVVSVVCCAGDGLCDELITHAEESYRLNVSVYDTGISTVMQPRAPFGLLPHRKTHQNN